MRSRRWKHVCRPSRWPQPCPHQVQGVLGTAAEKGVIHKNNASRRKGRLMKKLAALEAKK
jgi:hypothetical protein